MSVYIGDRKIYCAYCSLDGDIGKLNRAVLENDPNKEGKQVSVVYI